MPLYRISRPTEYLSIRFKSVIPEILRSTLALTTICATLAKLEGQDIFADDVALDVWELIDFEAGRIRS